MKFLTLMRVACAGTVLVLAIMGGAFGNCGHYDHAFGQHDVEMRSEESYLYPAGDGICRSGEATATGAIILGGLGLLVAGWAYIWWRMEQK